jgi:uncharacterized membrane protein
MPRKTLAILSILVLTASCSNLSDREQRTLTGGAIGAAGGAAAGWFFGAPALGAAAGGAAGAAIGGLTDWPNDPGDKK